MKSYNSFGTICILGPCNFTYAVCDLEYILNEDNSFKYIFKPNYSVIELLSSDIFQGIPGLNLDLRKEEYIRDDRIPTFISERVPSEAREDYYELLAKRNMDFMDPILYLIRSNEQYSGDKLFVIERHNHTRISFNDYVGYETNSTLVKNILSNICLGNDILIGKQLIDDSNRKSFHDVFLAIYSRSLENNKYLQYKGIEEAKNSNKYKGRKAIQVDKLLFLEYVDKVSKKKMTAKSAAEELGISIDKYYRLKKQLQN